MKRILSLVQNKNKIILLDELAFSSEIRKSEITRINILLYLFASLLSLFSIVFLFADQWFFNEVTTSIKLINFVILFGCITIYYTIARIAVGAFDKHEKNIPLVGRYINAIVEGLIPTVAMIFMQPEGDTIGALSMPPLLAYGIFLILATIRLDFGISLVTGLSASLSYLFFAIYTIEHGVSPVEQSFLLSPFNHIAKSFFLLAGGLTSGFVSTQIKTRILDTFKQIKQKEDIKNMFGEHVSPSVVQALLASKDQDMSIEKEISVMFLDIRGFTTFSENRSASEVYQELNKLFEFMIDVIQKHNGIINKFLGDGFLAIFGAPLDDKEHAQHACEAAIEISETLIVKKEKKEVAQLDIGIGIHSGKALTGNIGSSKRKEFTIIGDVVNLASRIEQLNKQLKTEILISKQVYQMCSNIKASNAGTCKVKGRDEKVLLYKIS